MKRIIHIITDLNNGGAEKMLYKLLKNSDKDKYYHEVISLIDEGIYGEKIKALNIKVHCLKINKSNLLISLLKARKIIMLPIVKTRKNICKLSSFPCLIF